MEPHDFGSYDELNVFPRSSSGSSLSKMGSSLPPIFESPTSSAPFLQKTGRFSQCWSRWSGRRSGWTPLHDSTQCRLITRENPYKFNLQRRGAPIAPLFGTYLRPYPTPLEINSPHEH